MEGMAPGPFSSSAMAVHRASCIGMRLIGIGEGWEIYS